MLYVNVFQSGFFFKLIRRRSTLSSILIPSIFSVAQRVRPWCCGDTVLHQRDVLLCVSSLSM